MDLRGDNMGDEMHLVRITSLGHMHFVTVQGVEFNLPP